MKNQLILDPGQHENIDLLGIACHLKEYRFCWSLNNQLGINLQRITDMNVPGTAKKTGENSFQVFYFNDSDKQQQYFLIGNHGPAGHLLERKPPVDYLLFVHNLNTSLSIPSAIKSIKSIQQVLTAFRISLQKIPDIESLLNDLELLLLDYQKK